MQAAIFLRFLAVWLASRSGILLMSIAGSEMKVSTINILKACDKGSLSLTRESFSFVNYVIFHGRVLLDNSDFSPIVAPWLHLWYLAYYVVRAISESKVFLELDG